MQFPLRAAVFVVVLGLAVALPVLADAPRTGEVVEGRSVPGIVLGGARADVEDAWGEPVLASNLPYYDGRQGLDGICRYDAEGGGQVTVYYKAPDGGPAQAAADDVVFHVRWTQAVSGWETTAGIDTTLALAYPEAVIAAYPDATVTYNSVFGSIARIEDRALGILVEYHTDYLTGTPSVTMSITVPSAPVPAPAETTRVTDIDLTAKKGKGERRVSALVRVERKQGSSASGATVSATWVFDGGTQAAQAVTGSNGYAYVELRDAPRGTVTLRIDDVELADLEFDAEGSILESSIRVR